MSTATMTRTRTEQRCMGSSKPAIFNIHAPECGECRDCNSCVATDERGRCLPHTTTDPLCFQSRLGR